MGKSRKKIPRYSVAKGQLLGTQTEGVPKFIIEEPLGFSNELDDIKMLATKQFRKGINVLILDTKHSALIGGMWCISTELTDTEESGRDEISNILQ